MRELDRNAYVIPTSFNLFLLRFNFFHLSKKKRVFTEVCQIEQVTNLRKMAPDRHRGLKCTPISRHTGKTACVMKSTSQGVFRWVI